MKRTASPSKKTLPALRLLVRGAAAVSLFEMDESEEMRSSPPHNEPAKTHNESTTAKANTIFIFYTSIVRPRV